MGDTYSRAVQIEMGTKKTTLFGHLNVNGVFYTQTSADNKKWIYVNGEGIAPHYDDSKTLGTSALKWKALYVNTIEANNINVCGNIIPDQIYNATSKTHYHTLGTSSIPWAAIYGTTINVGNAIVPMANETGYIGSSGKVWGGLYVKGLTVLTNVSSNVTAMTVNANAIFNENMILTSGKGYGSKLPTTGIQVGQIYFVKAI
jgi:hypothetical protein